MTMISDKDDDDNCDIDNDIFDDFGNLVPTVIFIGRRARSGPNDDDYFFL